MGISRLVSTCLLLVLAIAQSAHAADGRLRIRDRADERLVVLVDREVVGELPLDMTLAPGRYTVEVKVAEYASKSISLDIAIESGQTTSLVCDWHLGEIGEDLAATRGGVTSVLSLVGGDGRPLTRDLAGSLFREVDVRLQCESGRVSPNEVKVKGVEGEPSSRRFAAELLPEGTCTFTFRLEGEQATTRHRVTPGETDSQQATITVSVVSIQLVRLEEGDQAWIVNRTDSKDRQELRSKASVTLIAPEPFDVIVRHRGEEYRVAGFDDPLGQIALNPYATVFLAKSTRVDGLRVFANGSEIAAERAISLPAGRWTLRLEAPGFRTVEKTLELAGGQELSLSLGMSAVEPAKLSLIVAGPESYRVVIDGHAVEVSDDPIDTEPGDHTVTIQAEGWQPSVKHIRLDEGEHKELAFRLEPIPITVSFTDLPTGATVTAIPTGGGETLEQSSGSRRKVECQLAPGSYRISIEADEYTTFERTIELAAGAEPVTISAEMISTVVNLRFVGLPGDARVTLMREGGEEQEIEIEGAEAASRQRAGRIDYRIEAKRRATVEGTVDLQAGEPERIIQVDMAWTEIALQRRKSGARTGILGGLSGAFAISGTIFLVDSNMAYSYSRDWNDRYLATDSSEDALDYRAMRDDAADAGERSAIVGWTLIGVAAGTTIATVISAATGKKQAAAVGASVSPTPHGAALVLGGSW